jgi:hypothetical protein
MGKWALYELAHAALDGVGNRSLGQWEEWSGYAYHIRRRLSYNEAILVGPVIDVRGTPEAEERYKTAWPELSHNARISAREELHMSHDATRE